jgi:hypothetical protein
MKHYVSVFARQHITLIIYLFLALLCLILPKLSAGGHESNMGEELISLTVKDEPLGEVLYKVSVATGYDIVVDNKWRNYRVTASLEDVSLHKGLKRILRNLNSAIIYVSNKKIRIIIYDKISPEKASSAPVAEGSFDKTPASPPGSYLPSEHRPPTPQTIEGGDSSISDGEPSDTPAVSDNEGTNGDRSESDEEPSDTPAVSDNEGTNKNIKE